MRVTSPGWMVPAVAVVVAAITIQPSLRNVGQAPPCEMKVVSCNYAHLYSGTFSWTSTVRSPQAGTEITVKVTVTKGVARCQGDQTMWDAGRPAITGAISGPGLFAVEFEKDDQDSLVYNITAACPSPDHPDMGGPSRPAELGDNEQQSYEQRASAVGIDLVGSNNYPAPEEDTVNSVTGAVLVRWDLKRQP